MYAIIGSALYGNQGAASMLEASMQMIRKGDPDARFALLSVYPRGDEMMNKYDDLEIVDARPARLGLVTNPLAILYRLLPPARPSIRRADRAVAVLADADVLLDQGGITFSDGREKFLPFNVATLLPGLILGLPILKCSQAVGPFTGHLNRLFAKAILPRMRTIVARGMKTFDHLEGLGLTNVILGADLAFGLDSEPDIEVPLFVKATDRERPLVGFCPSEVLRKKFDAIDYASLLANQIDLFTAAGIDIVLFAHSSKPDTDARHNNDLPLCRAVYSELNNPGAVRFVDQSLTTGELRALIRQLDLLITSRFHGMVSALAEGVPPFVLGWGHKYTEVLDLFELDRAGLDGSALSDPALVGDAVAEAVLRSDEDRRLIGEHLPEIRDSARRGVEVALVRPPGCGRK
jgi:polysaccharide pyruvyl transferase WcaK-like protein